MVSACEGNQGEIGGGVSDLIFDHVCQTWGLAHQLGSKNLLHLETLAQVMCFKATCSIFVSLTKLHSSSISHVWSMSCIRVSLLALLWQKDVSESAASIFVLCVRDRWTREIPGPGLKANCVRVWVCAPDNGASPCCYGATASRRCSFTHQRVFVHSPDITNDQENLF